MTAQPNDVTRFTDRDLIVQTAERVSGLADQFKEFRDDMKALRIEVKNDIEGVREEARERFENHEGRLLHVEHTQAQQAGGISLGKWLAATLTGLAGLVTGWIAKTQ